MLCKKIPLIVYYVNFDKENVYSKVYNQNLNLKNIKNYSHKRI